MVDEDDVGPVMIYAGPYMEAVFLKSLLESEGLEVSLVTSFLGGMAGPGFFGGPATGGYPRLYVRRRDEDRARAVVQEFLRGG